MRFQLEAKAAIDAKPANASCCEIPANWKVRGSWLPTQGELIQPLLCYQ